jgi:hypothetical protein
MTATSLVLLAALGLAAVALARARIAIGSVRERPFAVPLGSEAAGVRYAFTAGFLPRAKESASTHLRTYLAGLTYHAGLFAMLARLALTLVPVAPPPPLERALAALYAVALACGLGLLAKRRLNGALRAISVPDDLVANLLADVALAAALAAALAPAATPLFQVAGAVLLVYAPLGKLRHMVFLVTSRRLWGRYYGQRGVRG